MMMKNSKVLLWLQGPNPPHELVVNPLFPRLQTGLHRIHKAWSFGRFSELSGTLILIVWLLAFRKLFTGSTTVNSPSGNGQNYLRLACNDRLWWNATFCGLHGENCEPFAANSFAFVCPSGCASVQVLEPHLVGDLEITYDTMVIGGLSPAEGARHVYRGDSFICQAAIHAGIISNLGGGCGLLDRGGEHSHFAASSHNGISSFEFLPSFPLTYTLSATEARCADPQWKLFILSFATTICLSLLATSSRFFVVLTLIIVFFQVALASDRPIHSDQATMLSMAFARFLPTAFVVCVMYQFCFRHTLHGLRGRLEKTVFWLGGCWFGALNNYTFDKLPISRLTAHDLRQQPGAITTLLILVAAIVIVAAGQIKAFWLEGRLLPYAGFYLALGLGIGCAAMIPNLQLRLHHYIIALILLPGTALRTRSSLLYQGLLFGLFINGVARWGYASILQTAEAVREDGLLGSALPQVLRTDQVGTSNVRFSINQMAKGFDGVSALVDDVERYRQSGDRMPFIFDWQRSTDESPTFFRFAFTNTLPLGGVLHGDYTKPSIWHPNGTWSDMT